MVEQGSSIKDKVRKRYGTIQQRVIELVTALNISYKQINY